MDERRMTRLEMYKEEFRSSPTWLGGPEGRVDEVLSLVGKDVEPTGWNIWLATKEVVFEMADGEPQFHHVMYMTDPINLDLVLVAGLAAVRMDEEQQLRHLAMAALYQIPVFPNTAYESHELVRLFGRLLEIGFLSDMDGKPQRLRLTSHVAATGYESSPIEELVPTRLIGPAEVMLIRRRISAYVGELEATNRTKSEVRTRMREAIEASRLCKSEPGKTSPMVGAVVAKDDRVLAVSHRGKFDPGDHAEYCALEKMLGSGESLAGATVYTTLEPCTTRNHPKVPCAVRLAERKIARVVVGMLDPNPIICGRGVRFLRERNIEVVLFDSDFASEVEDMNRNFARAVQTEYVKTGGARNGVVGWCQRQVTGLCRQW